MRQRSYAFGLNLDLAYPVESCPQRAWVDGCPEMRMEFVPPPERGAGRGPGVTLTEDGEGGYVLDLPGVGHFEVRGDGRLLCSHEDEAEGLWEQVLVGQVLPLAAVVAGLEVLHASCVAFRGVAVGFVGSSGAGKSTLAARFVGRGARFMGDDVLAISQGPECPVAHPGPNFVRLALGAPGGGADAAGKVARELLPMSEGCPLGVLYFLGHSDDATEVSFDGRVGAPELLAATFNLVVQSPERLERQLAVMAQADACGVPVRVTVTAGMAPAATARALAEDAAARVGRVGEAAGIRLGVAPGRRADLES